MMRVIRPFVNNRMAVNLAKEIFNININESSSTIVRELNSPEARCFYLRGSLPYDREREFTLKVCKFADFGEERGIIDELNDVMISVNNRGIPCSIPQQTSNGELYEMRKLSATRDRHTQKAKNEVSENSLLDCVVRLLSYIPGENMRGVPCDFNMFYQVGYFAAEIDKVLKVCIRGIVARANICNVEIYKY
jgi:Ser/Thr protein kinase RdoA (MazF antagonist)